MRRSVAIHGFDPFVIKAELTTHVQVFRWFCPEARRTSVLILRSPRPFGDEDAVWKELLSFWEKFACHEEEGR